MHQSSLGSLMLIAPTKLHPLWYTPLLPLLFLISAISVGYPMVIFESTLASSSFKLDDEMEVLAPLSRITTWLLGGYLLLKVGDMLWRQSYVYLLEGTLQSNAFVVELLLGVLLPWLLLLSPQRRHKRRTLFFSSCLIVGGLILNRINVFIIGFQPPVSDSQYAPAIGELLVTMGLIASLMFIYRILVTYLPILPAGHKKEG